MATLERQRSGKLGGIRGAKVLGLASFVPALAAALCLSGCGGASPDRANVLLVTVDTLRPDRLSCYGYEAHQTPRIDRLAAQGALFENAFTDTPWTTPSMSSVMTGVYPTVHGFKSTNAHRLDPAQTTLAEVLSERGYASAAIVGSFPLDSIYQLDQGFASYDDRFTAPIWVYPDHEFEPLPSEFRESPEDQAMFALAKALNDSRREDREVTDAALAWLAEDRPGPFFLWVHYFGPHTKPDWTVPEGERDRRHLGGYDPDVRIVDTEIGRLIDTLDAAGLAESTLVVFHADHGESLGEQGYLGHGAMLNDASMRVPLILRLPGTLARGVRVTSLVRNVDIFPTVLEVTGGPAEVDLSGRSLLPLARRGPGGWWSRRMAGDDRVAYMETFYPAHRAFARVVPLADGREGRLGLVRRAVRDDRFKLVRTEPHALLDASEGALPEIPASIRRSAQREELFDLASPEGEGADVAARHPQVLAELRAELERHRSMERPLERPAPIDEKTRLRLESLGYGE